MNDEQREARRAKINKTRPLTDTALVMIVYGAEHWEGKAPWADDVLQLVAEVKELRSRLDAERSI